VNRHDERLAAARARANPELLAVVDGLRSNPVLARSPAFVGFLHCWMRGDCTLEVAVGRMLEWFARQAEASLRRELEMLQRLPPGMMAPLSAVAVPPATGPVRCPGCGVHDGDIHREGCTAYLEQHAADQPPLTSEPSQARLAPPDGAAGSEAIAAGEALAEAWWQEVMEPALAADTPDVVGGDNPEAQADG
jgi:hypothetical protein